MTRVAVVGATGAVGTTMLELLREREFPADEIVPFATAALGRAASSTGCTVRALDAGRRPRAASTSRCSRPAPARLARVGAAVRRAGAVVIDNSSAFRRDPDVPLVVSEVNPHALERHHGLIANPNCSTMQLMVALAPIHRAAGIERLIVSTYQSVSGTGQQGGRRARRPGPRVAARHGDAGARGLPRADRVQRDRRRRQLRRGRRPHRRGAQDDVRDAQDPRGRVDRRRRHLRARAGADLPLGVGQHPDPRADLRPSEARELLADAPGHRRSRRTCRRRCAATGRDEVFVGRIRRDDSHPRALSMWVVGDNLRKGAATNAVQIAELLGRSAEGRRGCLRLTASTR